MNNSTDFYRSVSTGTLTSAARICPTALTERSLRGQTHTRPALVASGVSGCVSG